MAIVSSGLLFHVDAADPVSYPGSGSTWFDISGAGRNVTTSGVTYNASGGLKRMVFFAPTATFSDTGLPSGNASFSMGLWLLRNTNSGPGGVIRYGTRRSVGRGGNTTCSWYDGATDNQYVNYDLSAITSDDKWYNVLVTWTAATQTFRLYQQGCLVLSKAGGALNTTLSGATGGVLGKSNDNNYGFSGSMVEAYIYNRTLTDAEVWQNYYSTQSRFTASQLGPGTPAVAYPPFTPPTPVVTPHAGKPAVI